ncbi:hypothetical protein CCACVL1_20350 [Corchorus capsularis]|uniref:Homeobox domain-containing protein n=1 Tax=Corchorus capsularis TaxID=210143 RepID=A0A1R3HBP4_COCAP|nr:hypothetical protein CCACVL1_20350 [Corchorus capsularis]
MEGGGNMDMAGSGGTTGNSRWNPTKEQINMLENLYRQGIRTPSAEQIQHITSRLKVYGTIEGKNVFYWFQNHKARQRQKQKQENMAYINRYLHRTTQPIYPPPLPPAAAAGTNVVCRPYFLAQSDHHHLGLYSHCPKVIIPGGIKRRGRPEKMEMARVYETTSAPSYDHMFHQDYNMMIPADRIENYGVRVKNDETLALFPLHPTGIIEGRATNNISSNTFSGNSASSCETTAGIDQEAASATEQPFFDFFSSHQGSCESD